MDSYFTRAHDLDWLLRKTGKPVLAVLMTEDADGNVSFHDGYNVEISVTTVRLKALMKTWRNETECPG